MSNSEYHRYTLSGEILREDWDLALKLLGKLGLAVTPYADQSMADGLLQADPATLPPGTIPYTLEEITSPKQYLANEHLGEFWPEYRKDRLSPGSKADNLFRGLNMLAYPLPQGKDFKLTDEQRLKYAAHLGIRTVRPRSLVGFSDEYAPTAYGLWDDKKYGDAVIEVGSFITSVKGIAAGPIADRPQWIKMPTLRLFNALADKLQAQIKTANELDSQTTV